MAKKIIKKKIFWLATSLALLSLVVWAHNFTIDKTMAAAPTFSVTVGNAAPTIDWTGMTGFHNGATTITPEEWAEGDGVFVVTTTFAVIDTNGWADISTTTIFVYRSDVGIANCGWGTSTDLEHCYPTTSTLSGWEPTGGAGDICDRTSVNGNYAYFWCTTTLSYVADPTDAGSTYAAQSWVVYASTSDLSWAIDIHFFGGSLTHETNDAYHIPAFKQQFSTTSGLVYGGAGIAWLATTTGGVEDGVTHDVTIKKATTTVPGPTTADQIYWGIGIPAGQLTGTYSSTTNFIATSTIVNP